MGWFTKNKETKGCLDGKTTEMIIDFFNGLAEFMDSDRLFFIEQYADLKDKEQDLFQSWFASSKHYHKSLRIEDKDWFKIYPESLDLRMIDCACGNESCKIGLSFDTSGESELMKLIHKHGNENVMHLSIESIDEIIGSLRQARRNLVKIKKRKNRNGSTS